MKLKPIPQDTVVHTPTEVEAKELLAILHENGYEWNSGDDLSVYSYAYNKEAIGFMENKKVVAYIYLRTAIDEGKSILTLAEFKERYCEMTEPLTEKAEETSVIQQKPQPKFVKGQRVYCRPYGYPFVISEVVVYDDNEPHYYSENGGCYKESILEPYTEPETKPTEDKEAKELNLCELLRGHEGEEFYSPCYGNVTLSEVRNDRIIITAKVNGKNHTLCPDGTHISGAVLSCVNLLPSVGLYQQYPLDAAKAWSVWQSEQKKPFICIHWGEVDCNGDEEEDYTGNTYFRTPSDRDKCIEEINAIIEKYSKK